MTLTTTRWMVVRHSDDGHDWLDVQTSAATAQDAALNALVTDDQLPQWAKANPVVRTVEVSINENILRVPKPRKVQP